MKDQCEMSFLVDQATYYPLMYVASMFFLRKYLCFVNRPWAEVSHSYPFFPDSFGPSKFRALVQNVKTMAISLLVTSNHPG